MNVSHSQRVVLIRRRAHKMGFRGANLDDAQQEIVMDVLSFQYQPEKSNGATEQTALISYVDGRLATIRRTQKRYRRNVEQFALGTSDEVRQDSSMEIDIHEALTRLSDRDRDLCEGLMNQECLHDIAKRWGCSWHTVARRLACLRKRFQSLGLDQWVREGVS